MNEKDIERKLKKVIYAFIVSVIIIVAAFAATIYYYETKEISRAVAVGEGLFAKVFVDNNIGTAPLAVNFSSLLFNFEGTPTYHWDFGDGNTSNATNPTHNYTKAGEYICNLTVIDVTGKIATASTRILVSVNQPPTVVALVTPITSLRPSKPFWLIQLLEKLDPYGYHILLALLDANSSLVNKTGWITCEAQVSDPEGDEIVNYKWELTLPNTYSPGGKVDYPKRYFEGKDLKTITFPLGYTFRDGPYDIRVNVTDSAGNTGGDIKRFTVEKSDLENRIMVLKSMWNNFWGPNFDYQMEPVQKILIKIWVLLGPMQKAMNNMVKRILAPLPPDLRDTIYSLYYTLIWDKTDTNYHKPNFNAPTKPSDPSPADGATGVSVWTNLSWKCSDADGDTLSYDIYFGRDPSPPLIKTGYDKTTYDLGEQPLASNTKYYWKIVARDHPKPSAYGGSKTSESSVWSFTTA
ncbi:MAG: PKD domain-containing protein [Thermoplasmatota archaeon]|jgi:PKD repeat protein